MKYYLVLELVVICFHSFIIVMCFDNSIVIILTGRDRSRCSRVKVGFLVRISGTLIEFKCFFQWTDALDGNDSQANIFNNSFCCFTDSYSYVSDFKLLNWHSFYISSHFNNLSVTEVAKELSCVIYNVTISVSQRSDTLDSMQGYINLFLILHVHVLYIIFSLFVVSVVVFTSGIISDFSIINSKFEVMLKLRSQHS